MKIDRDTFYITELKHNSHTAFSYLYDTYADMLYGYILLHTKSPFMAEEIVQDTFLKIWTSRHNIDVEGSFKSLLFTIARNRIIDAFRKQVSREEFMDFMKYKEENQPTENSVEKDVYFDDFYEKLIRAKETLPEKQRLIFELSREQGMDSKTIAAKLGVSEQTVKNQLSTALKVLRKLLSDYRYFFL